MAHNSKLPITQAAARLSLTQYQIYTRSGAVQTNINLHKRIFAAKGAPLTPFLEDAGWSDAPGLTVDGRRYRLRKILRSDKFFANRFDLDLLEEGGGSNADSASAISARCGIEGSTTLIEFEGSEYALTPRSWFGFSYQLDLRGAQISTELARFRDTSPFLTFSAKRRYELESKVDTLPPLLVAFAFLLAVSSAYRQVL